MIKKVKGWNPYITVLENENRVIIANRWNGQWMKISKECFDIILEILKKDAKEIAWEDIFADCDPCFAHCLHCREYLCLET